MARIRIEDLPKDMKISKEDMQMVVGGAVDCSFKIDGVPGKSANECYTQDTPGGWIDALLGQAGKETVLFPIETIPLPE